MITIAPTSIQDALSELAAVAGRNHKAQGTARVQLVDDWTRRTVLFGLVTWQPGDPNAFQTNPGEWMGCKGGTNDFSTAPVWALECITDILLTTTGTERRAAILKVLDVMDGPVESLHST